MFGISGGELFVLLIVAALIMGPKNVAQVLHGLRKLLETLRKWSAQLRNEASMDLSAFGLGPDEAARFKDFDLRQYDPRQMVKEAVQEEMNAWLAATTGAQKVGKDTASGAMAAMQQAVAPFPQEALPQSDIATQAPHPQYLAPQPPSSTETALAAETALASGPTSAAEPTSAAPIDLHTILNRPDLGGSR